MASIKWRNYVKIVAIIDLALSTFALVLAVTAVIVLATTGLVRGISMDKKDIFRIFRWIFIVISIFPLTIIFWSALMLRKSTTPDVRPKSAAQKAKAWIYVNIIFFSLTASFLLVNILTINIVLWQCVSLVFLLLFRGSLLYIVGEFVPELEQAEQACRRHSRYALVNLCRSD